MSELKTLSAQQRSAFGKGHNRRLRTRSMVPGVYYTPDGKRHDLVSDLPWPIEADTFVGGDIEEEDYNFDGIPVAEGQELSFQGDALVVKGGDKTTYYEKTESEGFNELFSVTEKDGKKTYTNDDEPYDEKEAQAFIDKIAQEAVKPLADILKKWK